MKNNKLFLSLVIVISVAILSVIAIRTGAWFIWQKEAGVVVLTSSGVKLIYNEDTITKEGDNYYLKLSANSGLCPGDTVTVTPVEVKRTKESNYYDCYLRYKLNYYYSLDNGSTYTQTTMGNPALHLSISSFTNGTNFLNSQYGEYSYLTTGSGDYATLKNTNLQTLTSNDFIYLYLK